MIDTIIGEVKKKQPNIIEKNADLLRFEANMKYKICQKRKKIEKESIKEKGIIILNTMNT